MVKLLPKRKKVSKAAIAALVHYGGRNGTDALNP